MAPISSLPGMVFMPPDPYLDIPFLQNMGVLVTYKCQVACPHCIIEAGPNRTEEVSLSDAFDWIEQISKYRDGAVKVISLTGGEPFVDPERLQKIAAFGREKGLIVTAVTNAYWASTPEEAGRTLQNVPAVEMISISTDVYHQASIPFDRVKNAIMAAKRSNLPYNISICTESEEDADYKNIVDKLLEITDPGKINTVITLVSGRAKRTIVSQPYEISTEPPAGACVVCGSPVIFPDGRVIACIGPLINLKTPHPLMLGNLKQSPLSDILDKAESNPILHELRIMGPKQLVNILIGAGYGELLPKRFLKGSICDLCYALMSDPGIAEALDTIARDPEYVRKIAYARVYYLNETRMAEDYLKYKA